MKRMVPFYVSLAWSCLIVTALPYSLFFVFADRFHDGLVLLTIALVCWAVMGLLLFLDSVQVKQSGNDSRLVFLSKLLRRHVTVGAAAQLLSNFPLLFLLADGNLYFEELATPWFAIWLVGSGVATVYMLAYNIRVLRLARRV